MFRRHYESFGNYHVNLEKLLQHDISNSEFYRYLVYKLKKIIENLNFCNRFKRIVNRLKSRVQLRYYAVDCMTKFDQSMVESYVALFSCTAVVQASDLMMAST